MNDDTNKVGYKKPPVHTQFKPGKSGNPLGRPKNKMNNDIQDAIHKALSEKRAVIIDGKKRRLRQSDIIARAQIEKAVKGDTKSAEMIIKLSEKYKAAKEEGVKFPTVYIIDDIPDDIDDD